LIWLHLDGGQIDCAKAHAKPYRLNTLKRFEETPIKVFAFIRLQ